jgi:hypothetical protein
MPLSGIHVNQPAAGVRCPVIDKARSVPRELTGKERFAPVPLGIQVNYVGGAEKQQVRFFSIRDLTLRTKSARRTAQSRWQ